MRLPGAVLILCQKCARNNQDNSAPAWNVHIGLIKILTCCLVLILCRSRRLNYSYPLNRYQGAIHSWSIVVESTYLFVLVESLSLSLKPPVASLRSSSVALYLSSIVERIRSQSIGSTSGVGESAAQDCCYALWSWDRRMSACADYSWRAPGKRMWQWC